MVVSKCPLKSLVQQWAGSQALKWENEHPRILKTLCTREKPKGEPLSTRWLFLILWYRNVCGVYKSQKLIHQEAVGWELQHGWSFPSGFLMEALSPLHRWCLLGSPHQATLVLSAGCHKRQIWWGFITCHPDICSLSFSYYMVNKLGHLKLKVQLPQMTLWAVLDAPQIQPQGIISCRDYKLAIPNFLRRLYILWL